MKQLDRALDNVSKGWAVFPCVWLEKRPATWHGFMDATTDHDQVVQWFKGSPRNIGVRTGDASGLAVIDLDDYKGVEVQIELQRLVRELGSLPITYMVETRAGGRHLYFKLPKGYDLRSYNNVLAKGIDLRANGGYVVGADSHCKADKTYPEGGYRELNTEPLAELPTAWADAWLALNATQDAIAAKKAAKAAAQQLELV